MVGGKESGSGTMAAKSWPDLQLEKGGVNPGEARWPNQGKGRCEEERQRRTP